jgi:hypothetical protein
MHKIRTVHSNLIPDDLAEVCRTIACLVIGWERNVTFKIFSYEEALKENSIAASWIDFAQNAALGSHTYILEDGPELPKVCGPHAEMGGDVLEATYAQGCTAIEESRTKKKSGRARGQVSAAETRSRPAGIVSNDYTSANHEDLQAVKDPRGAVGVHARRDPGLRCSQPPLGDLAK